MSRKKIGFAVLGLMAVALGACNLFCGAVNIAPGELIKAFFESNSDSMAANILWNLRIPHLVAAILAGASLSVSGLALQNIFRNPLAGPFVLGISSGASLGVALALLAGLSFGGLGVLGGASVGAFLVAMLIMGVASRFSRVSVLLIVGLLLGYFIDSAVSLLIAGCSAESLRVYVSWGMGSFGRLTLEQVWTFAVPVVVGLGLIVSAVQYLNTSLVGDDFAQSLGVNVKRSRLLVLLGASVLAGVTTAFCGPVSFIGIAVPHLSFMLFKTTNCRILLPGTLLCGVNLALLAALFPVSVPLNAILSIVGVPVILWVLLRSAKAGDLE